APAGYALLGEGATDARGNGPPNASVSVAGFGQFVSTFQKPPTILANIVAATAPSMASGPPAAQPRPPPGSGTVPPPVPLWDARHVQDAVFEGWDTVTDGLPLNWT